MSEKTVSVTVEAVGEIAWGASAPGSDPRWREPMRVALLRDDDGHRYIVHGGQCYRNGTTISDAIVGLKGEVEVYRCLPIGFNCPTMFGQQGL